MNDVLFIRASLTHSMPFILHQICKTIDELPIGNTKKIKTYLFKKALTLSTKCISRNSQGSWVLRDKLLAIYH